MFNLIKPILITAFVTFYSYSFAAPLESYQCKFDSTEQVLNIKIKEDKASISEEDSYTFFVLKNNDIGVIISKPYLSEGVELDGFKQNDVGVLSVILDKETGQFSFQYLGLLESTEAKTGTCEV